MRVAGVGQRRRVSLSAWNRKLLEGQWARVTDDEAVDARGGNWAPENSAIRVTGAREQRDLRDVPKL